MKSNSNNLLDHYGRINAGFLHAYGEKGTEKLLQLIKFEKEESFLEVGFGTGATLVNIASKEKHVKMFGIEQSEVMLEKAQQRIRWCGLSSRISLRKVEKGQPFPFPDDFFDRIIIESVLAIQDDATLQFLLSEIKRVLKPSGIFYLNETIWLSSITKQEINKINSYCLSKFGIIQASGTYSYRIDWQRLLETKKFHVLQFKSINDIELHTRRTAMNTQQHISKIFSFYGRMRGKLISTLKEESSFYKQAMKNVFENKQYLEGIIVVASGNETDE